MTTSTYEPSTDHHVTDVERVTSHEALQTAESERLSAAPTAGLTMRRSPSSA